MPVLRRPLYSWPVAPYAGAWIEIDAIESYSNIAQVAPYAGAWIEINSTHVQPFMLFVAPYAGAWIEMLSTRPQARSTPSRTLRGCVD